MENCVVLVNHPASILSGGNNSNIKQFSTERVAAGGQLTRGQARDSTYSKAIINLWIDGGCCGAPSLSAVWARAR